MIMFNSAFSSAPMKKKLVLEESPDHGFVLDFIIYCVSFFQNYVHECLVRLSINKVNGVMLEYSGNL